MLRYHKKIYFPVQDTEDLKSIVDDLNNQNFSFSSHCLDNIKYRTNDIERVLNTVNNTVLSYNQVFEYYKAQNIEKICFRLQFNEDNDIILVLSSDKNIITIYFNSTIDNHETLKAELYNTG